MWLLLLTLFITVNLPRVLLPLNIADNCDHSKWWAQYKRYNYDYHHWIILLRDGAICPNMRCLNNGDMLRMNAASRRNHTHTIFKRQVLQRYTVVCNSKDMPTGRAATTNFHCCPTKIHWNHIAVRCTVEPTCNNHRYMECQIIINNGYYKQSMHYVNVAVSQIQCAKMPWPSNGVMRMQSWHKLFQAV